MRGMVVIGAVMRGSRRRAATAFAARKRAIDELLDTEIARRRADPDLEQRATLGAALSHVGQLEPKGGEPGLHVGGQVRGIVRHAREKKARADCARWLQR